MPLITMNRAGILSATVAVTLLSGCGDVFNPAFVNTFAGNVFPLAPGPTAPFVLVQCINESGQNAEFQVTIERERRALGQDGQPIFQPDGTPTTRIVVERKRLQTLANAPANQMGVLFGCADSPVTRVGLGENLLPDDTAVFIGGAGPAGTQGFGVPAEGMNPLTIENGDFVCGDTVIFRAIQSPGVAGNVRLESFVLSGNQQSGDYSGPDTFLNFFELLESLLREEEP